jgi:hypothetical protein
MDCAAVVDPLFTKNRAGGIKRRARKVTETSLQIHKAETPSESHMDTEKYYNAYGELLSHGTLMYLVGAAEPDYRSGRKNEQSRKWPR